MQPLLIPQSNQLYVIVGGRGKESLARLYHHLTELAAWLALRGPLTIIDGGNRANPYPLARQLRRWSNDPVQALNNIRIARAFTCYQVVALLERVCANGSAGQPCLVYDLLATFYDESILFVESQRLFERSLALLRLIGQTAPVVVSTRPPPADFPQRAVLVDQLCFAVHQVWQESPLEPLPPQQLNLPL